MKHVRTLFLGTALVLATHAAEASPLIEHTGALIGEGGFNARFTESGPAAAYFNPAFLTRSKTGISIGTFVLADRIRVTLHSREGLGVDVPSYPDSLQYEYDGQTAPFDNLTMPTRDLFMGCANEQNPCRPRPRQHAGSSNETRTYAVIGLVNQILGPKLVAGVYAMLPLRQYTTARSFFVDEREQFFSNSLHPEFYADRLTSPSLAVGFGSQLLERLSVGVSFTIALQNRAEAGVYVPDAGNQRDSLLLTTDVSVIANTAMHVGATYEPWDSLTFSATAHSPSRFGIVTQFANLLPNGDEQIATRRAVHDHMPWLISLGAEHRFKGGVVDYTVVGGAVLGLWSTYVNRQGEKPLPGYEFRDTISPSFGVRADTGPARVGLDLMFQPSPVPEQKGRTNYVDNHKLTGSLGGEFDFEVSGHRISVGAHIQAHKLLHRRHTKITPDTSRAITNPLDPNYGQGINPSLVRDELPDVLEDALRPGQPYAPAAGLQTNNPGYPGYESDGYLLGGGVYVTLHY